MAVCLEALTHWLRYERPVVSSVERVALANKFLWENAQPKLSASSTAFDSSLRSRN